MSTLLDTHVLSELLREAPAPAVLAWFAAQHPQTLFVSALAQAEMALGAALLKQGKRRAALEHGLRALFDEDFAGRVLPFDTAAVPVYADLASTRRAAGRPITQFDAQIAAIARVHGLALATRHVGDFQGCGLQVVDPWSAAG